MEYYFSLKLKDITFTEIHFKDDIPIINRRKALKTIREGIERVKNNFDGEGVPPHIEALLKMLGISAMDAATKMFEYHVFLKIGVGNAVIPIESSHYSEEDLDCYRAWEYTLYRDRGYNTGGDPVEVYIPSYEGYVHILKDENIVGIRQLLDS
jgi:hypothetical protein